MGNICSKSANQPDNFSTPGRTIGSTPQNTKVTTTPVPRKVATSTPGRTLGGRDEAPSPDDARAAAARAAEERAAKASKPGGKLATQAKKNKAMTDGKALGQLASDTRAAREADENTKLQNYN